MGRIKTSLAKKIALTIYEQNKDKISADFKKNKEIVKRAAPLKSKKMINVIAGYLTRLAQTKE